MKTSSSFSRSVQSALGDRPVRRVSCRARNSITTTKYESEALKDILGAVRLRHIPRESSNPSSLGRDPVIRLPPRSRCVRLVILANSLGMLPLTRVLSIRISFMLVRLPNSRGILDRMSVCDRDR